MFSQKRYGQIGMFGAVWFFLNLLVEYRYNLFPPGSGGLYVVNQLMFYVAMICMLWMLIGLWGNQVSGDRWYGRFPLGLFIFGWAMLIVGGFVMLFIGSDEIVLFPIGGISIMFGSLLTGIMVAIVGRWHGWQRFAPLFLGLVQPVSTIIRGTVEPNLLIESLWMLGWFLVGLALYQNTNHVPYKLVNEGELA